MLYKKIALFFLLLFSSKQLSCETQPWFGHFDNVALKGTAVVIASITFYKGLLFTLNALLRKTQNPDLLRLILRCIKFIDFNFDPNDIYCKICEDGKRKQHLPLFKILSQNYNIEPYNCAPRGCCYDNLYLAVQEGDCEYLNILFKYENSTRIKYFNQYDLYCLLNELIINITGNEKYFYTARALLQQPNTKNLNIYYDEEGQYNLPLTRVAYNWLLAEQNNNTQLMKSNKDIFGLLLYHRQAENDINNFEFKPYHADAIVLFLNKQNSNLCNQFFERLTNPQTRKFFLVQAQALQNRNQGTWNGKVIIDHLTRSLESEKHS